MTRSTFAKNEQNKQPKWRQLILLYLH
jgi:hypothetical protein